MPDEEKLRDIARVLREDTVDPAVDRRVMATVRRLPRHRRLGVWARLNRPRTLTVGTFWWAAAAAAVLVIGGLSGAGVSKVRTAVRSATADAVAVTDSHPVQFTLVAPGARKVSVVGDFNGWDAAHAAYQARHRGGNVWTVTAHVPAGYHRYSFVVDDSLWISDPNAPRIQVTDDGATSSAIVVGGGQ